MDAYGCFADLSAQEVRGKDYDVLVCHREGTQIIVIAPHGGGIEPRTSGIAEKIAGTEFSLYCFRGIKPSGNARLHITSQNFDEPECLALLARHSTVLAIHGCAQSGERVLLGGLDKPLIADLSGALQAVGIRTEVSGHQYTATHPRNVCNRGVRAAGAQFELSLAFRRGGRVPTFVKGVQGVLRGRQNAA